MLKAYQFFPVSEEQSDGMRENCEMFSALAEHILETCPDCRERATALTFLEGACMWANKSVSHGVPNVAKVLVPAPAECCNGSACETAPTAA